MRERIERMKVADWKRDEKCQKKKKRERERERDLEWEGRKEREKRNEFKFKNLFFMFLDNKLYL